MRASSSAFNETTSCGSVALLSYIMWRTSVTSYLLSSMEINPSLETQICVVCLFDFNFSILYALGRFIGSPEYSLKTVVTMKKISNMKIMSGIEAVGISVLSLIFLLNDISQPFLLWKFF